MSSTPWCCWTWSPSRAEATALSTWTMHRVLHPLRKPSAASLLMVNPLLCGSGQNPRGVVGQWVGADPTPPDPLVWAIETTASCLLAASAQISPKTGCGSCSASMVLCWMCASSQTGTQTCPKAMALSPWTVLVQLTVPSQASLVTSWLTRQSQSEWQEPTRVRQAWASPHPLLASLLLQDPPTPTALLKGSLQLA